MSAVNLAMSSLATVTKVHEDDPVDGLAAWGEMTATRQNTALAAVVEADQAPTAQQSTTIDPAGAFEFHIFCFDR